MPSIVTNGLSLHLDASNLASYTPNETWWNDLSGNGFNFTLNTGISFDAGALSFVDGVATSPNFGTIFEGGEFTYEIWINTNNLNGNILSERNLGGWTVSLIDLVNGEVRVGFWTGGTSYRTIGTITTGSLYQIVMKYSGDTLTGYINGIVGDVAGGFYKDYPGDPYYTIIGDSEITNFGNGSSYNGKVSNVKFYNRALTDEEVLQNYLALTSEPEIKKKSITFQRNSKLISTPPIAYKYYKWHITDIRQNLDSFTQTSEFTFLVDGSGIDMTVASVSLLNAHTSPGGEGVGNLIDDNIYTKFLDLSWESGGSEIVFEFPTAQLFNGYKWATANDSEWRDPKSWTLYGSNDNTNWDVLDIVSGFISTTDRWVFNEPFLYTSGFDANTIQSKVTFTANTKPKTNDGTTALRAGDSAYQIKTDFPSSTDGLYWIKNPNINNGEPFQIYADMTTEGGGWTLIMQNNYNNGTWNQTNALLKNQTTPPSTLATGIGGDDSQNYSIISWADYLKSFPSGFQYMIDANSRLHYGGIWEANENYSFTGSVDLTQYQASGSAYFGTDVIAGSDGFRQNITEIQKFPTNDGTWNYENSALEHRMPWYSTDSVYYVGSAVITTTHDDGGSWWGTLITDNGWTPAPWMSSYGLPDPGVIWYWVR